ncbi:IQ domain-containing protein/TIG domain-containing protein/CG-1 domain-containing protein/Ank_2 domain-containing protein [Cephalotus follicularis]|uniref:IQ domain-containing protein/TIG domain-containing protein/CG-1 domain-containing protein/Ank_2 domain-containing protein n=1 Tax=Cephalotus follicularis TaxID=3775 RepID=A0A1Q3DAL6_CEPFO|nr:IQ domain-containing protein/TIG domain-containing protein/CG-1 domain-containing protein/Ank_2 domain-containing protein [Cephalotus follicularis]
MMRRQQQHQDQSSRVFYELSAMVLNLLRSPPSPMPFSDHSSVVHSRSPALTQISPSGFASLLLGISLALMLCGSVTFFIGFMLMPWVLGLIMVFYVAGIVSAISMLGRSIFCYAMAPPSSPRKDIPCVVTFIWSRNILGGNLSTSLSVVGVTSDEGYMTHMSKTGLKLWLSSYRLIHVVIHGSGDDNRYDINHLYQEGQTRWLKPAEVFFILQNHDKYQLTEVAPKKPTSGSLFLFNKRVLRFFRKDGHSWRKKKDGRTVGEAHERLKVGNVEALNCYYAHGEQNPNFQRRSYWMLDPAYEHIVLVHYREITEGRPSSASIAQLSPGSSTFSPSQRSNSNHNPGSAPVFSDFCDPYQNLSSPEVSSDLVLENNCINRRVDCTSSTGVDVSEALRRLEEQLSLNDDSVKEIDEHLNVSDYELLEFEGGIFEQDPYAASTKGHDERQDHHNNVVQLQGAASMLLPQEVENFKISQFTYPIQRHETNSNYYTVLFDQGQISMPFEPESSLTVAQKQKFTIREISPEWGYAAEATKVMIVGSFLCDPLESAWRCMFGDTEVPVHIIQEGAICCEAPPHLPGKVTLCITSGNRESCSEIREFEYRVQSNSCAHCDSSRIEASKSPEELLLLVRFVQMLLSDSSMQKGESKKSESHLLRPLKADDDSWDHVIEAILVGNGASPGTIDWLLQELLKDKLLQWLSSRSQVGCGEPGYSLSKKEQAVLHIVAGLGYEWALNPILGHGVSINFRDINGWTALHWAARFGREKMVAALMASGASAGAVTDPTSQDPTGKTPASIAASGGHKGLAGYLSEVALTSHLSSLTMVESELSKGAAAVEAEMTVNSVSNGSLVTNEDQLSLKDTLAAVRNAAQAAARIQLAFRAHSFRNRQQREAASSINEYGIASNDIRGVSALSKLTFRNARDYNSAALSIQKKYRGWKGRKDFLALRQKVVKIQAHVRGYQVRKNYKVCWAVGILEKVVLRWRRKGVGLRGFRHDIEFIDESDDEDILKVFRKQKVDVAIDEAVSRVLSMVDSSEARQQYRRMLERYRKAKAELGDTNEGASPSIPAGDTTDMENDELFLLP